MIAGFATSRSSVCVSCHKPQGSALRASSHATVSCYRCHLAGGLLGIPQAKASEWFRMYPRAVGGVRLASAGERIPRDACAECHENDEQGVIEVGGLRIKHAACAAPPTPCDQCHGDTGHGTKVRWPREPVMDDCLACHARRGASAKCTTCHAGKLQAERIVSGPWQATHGANWKSTHGMGNLATCKACHPAEKCIECHATPIPHAREFMASHGPEALKQGARCTACHKRRDWCASCHGIQMPHPDGFLKAHPKKAKNAKDPVCLKCHASADCVNCHTAHTHPGRTEGTLSEFTGIGGDDS